MRSSRSTHAILSLPHKYRVPQGRKRSLGYARDDDTRERAISHSLSFLHVEGCPCGADLSSAFGAPLLQGATPLACKSATPKRHFLPDGKVNEMRVPPSPYQKPSPRGEGAPKGRIGHSRYESERENHLKCAVNESTLSTAGAVPLPQWGRLRYENTASPVSSFRAKREIFLAQRTSDEREMRSST